MLLIRLLFKEKRNEDEIRIVVKKMIAAAAAAWNHLNELASCGSMVFLCRGSCRIFLGALFYAEFYA